MVVKAGSTNTPAPDERAAATPQAYWFGSYRLERATRRLLREGEPVALTPKAFDTLLALIERRDRVVDKSELMRVVWPDSFVEEANLSQTVFVLRKTLGEGPNGRPFIDTVPRRGYRFAADVRVEATPASVAGRDRLRGSRALWIAGVVLAAAGLAMLAASWNWWGGTTSRVESLVVLPFGNLSGDAEQDYLADGMTDALITNLGQISELRVISRTSAMTYKTTRKTVPEIARELSVDAVVEGTVQRSGERVRLNLKLIEASTDRTLWAQSYERDMRNALELQNEIARTIASRIAVTLTPRESARLAEAPRVNPKVYEAYLKGRYFWNRRSEPDMRQAIEHFEEALRHDPGYAPAHSGLADSYTVYGTLGWSLAGDKAWPRAIAAAEKALELDDLLADGHTSRAGIAMNYELDWARAEKGYRRALELNPGYANAHHWYGYYLLLTGRLKEAEAEMRRALELDPLSPIINANIGFCFYAARQYDAAMTHWRKALEMHRNYRVLHGYMTMAYTAKGMYAEALAEIQKQRALSGAGPSETAILVHIYGRIGRTREARALLSQLLSGGDVPAYYIALAYVGLGEDDNAFKWLDKSLEERAGPFNELNIDPMFDPLRADARFGAFLRRMGFPVSSGPTSEVGPLTGGSYSTASLLSSAEIRSDRRKRRSLALRSNWRFAGSKRDGVVIFVTAPPLVRLTNPTTASRVTRMSNPASRALARQASTCGLSATAAAIASASSFANRFTTSSIPAPPIAPPGRDPEASPDPNLRAPGRLAGIGRQSDS